MEAEGHSVEEQQMNPRSLQWCSFKLHVLCIHFNWHAICQSDRRMYIKHTKYHSSVYLLVRRYFTRPKHCLKEWTDDLEQDIQNGHEHIFNNYKRKPTAYDNEIISCGQLSKMVQWCELSWTGGPVSFTLEPKTKWTNGSAWLVLTNPPTAPFISHQQSNSKCPTKKTIFCRLIWFESKYLS